MCSEYAMFLHPSFDPNQFAHSIVNNEPYPAPEASSSSTLNADANATTTATNNGTTRSTADKPPLNTNTGFTKGLGSGADGGDVSAALGKLNFGVEDLQRQLKAEVSQCCSELSSGGHALNIVDSNRSPNTTHLCYYKRPVSEDSNPTCPKSGTSSHKSRAACKSQQDE